MKSQLQNSRPQENRPFDARCDQIVSKSSIFLGGGVLQLALKYLLFFLPVLLFSVQALDTDMTPQEKKDTGVLKLTDKEKGALQQWIDNHYAKRAQPLQTPQTTGHPQISESLSNGHYLRLTDGTLWAIRPQDTLITQSWITPADIIVTQSGNPAYPYKLTNGLTGSSVFAKKTTSLPNSQPPQPIQK